jgi:hypothetical protein
LREILRAQQRLPNIVDAYCPEHTSGNKAISMSDDNDRAQKQRVLDTARAAAYCGSATSTFEKLRVTGGGPPFVRITARRVGYLVDDLDEWLSGKARYSSTSTRG